MPPSTGYGLATARGGSGLSINCNDVARHRLQTLVKQKARLQDVKSEPDAFNRCQAYADLLSRYKLLTNRSPCRFGESTLPQRHRSSGGRVSDGIAKYLRSAKDSFSKSYIDRVTVVGASIAC